MANQLKLVATITPANTAVEASTDNGATWKAVAMSTVGSQQEGLLVDVPAGTYPAGTVKLRSMAFPSVVVNEPMARTVLGAATSSVANIYAFVGQSNDNGYSPVADLPAAYRVAYGPQVQIWNKQAGAFINYQAGVNDQAVTGTSFGADAAFACEWFKARQGTGEVLYLFKKDSYTTTTNGNGTAAWLTGTGGNPPVFPNCLSEWQAATAWLTAAGKAPRLTALITGIGEQNGTDGDPDFKTSLTNFVNAFRTNFPYEATTKTIICHKQRASDLFIATAQVAYAAVTANAQLVSIPSPAFYDGVHYTADSAIRLGTLEYNALFNAANGMASGFTNVTDGAWDVAAYDTLSSDTSYANGTASTTGTGNFNHGGVNTITPRLSGATARTELYHAGPATRTAAVGLDERPALLGFFDMRYMIYISASGALNFHSYAGNPAGVPGYQTRVGYYYALRVDAGGTVRVEESVDNRTFATLYVFPEVSAVSLYAHFDLLNNTAGLAGAQSRGLGAYVAPVSTYNDPIAAFGSAADVTYTAATNSYSTAATDNSYGHTVMGTAVLAAGQSGIISFVAGTKTRGILGLHTSASPFSSYQIFAGIYLDPAATGPPTLSSIQGTAVAGISPSVNGTRYGVRRTGSTGAVEIVRLDGSAWVVVAQLANNTGPLYAGLTLNGAANNGAVDVRQSW